MGKRNVPIIFLIKGVPKMAKTKKILWAISVLFLIVVATPVHSAEIAKSNFIYLKNGSVIECDEAWIARKDIIRCKKGKGILFYSIDAVDLKKTFGESFVEFPTTTHEEESRVKDSFTQEHKKSSWYIGFGIGTGDGSCEVDGEKVTSDEWFEDLSTSPILTLNFGVGGIINPKLHLGFDWTAIRQEGSNHSVERMVQINNYLFALTYFPKGEGLFLKAGAGASSIIYDVSGGSPSAYSGTAVLGGAGYAFWLGKSFNLCLNADYSHQTYSNKNAPDSSHFWNLYVSFYWF
jgi:hypothetical protein